MERERREGEKKKKRKRKRRRREAKIKKVWIHDFCMDFYDFWYGTLWNSKVCVKFHAIVWVIACP